MIRTQIQLTEEQARRVRALARREGVSMAEWDVEGERRGRGLLFAGARDAVAEIDLAADDRLDALAERGDRKLERGEHVVRIRHGDRGETHVADQSRQLFQADRPFQQGIFGVKAEMDESGRAAHAARLDRAAGVGNAGCGKFFQHRGEGWPCPFTFAGQGSCCGPSWEEIT